jgi:iron complex outermembrane receptor protein
MSRFPLTATLRGALLGAVCLPALYSSLNAQPVAPNAKPAAASGVEEVRVTARRRSERLQKVPVAVTVLSGAAMKAANLNTLQDILATVPSADFRTSSSNKDRTIFIRGLGTISTSPGVEPDVSTVIDGVVLARAGQATVEIPGVDQIEVLRGPQGTLFGKNASAGVVNITTRQPTQDFHAWANAGYFGGGDEYRLEGGVSGTIAPNLTGVLSVLDGSFDGNVHDAYNGKTVNGFLRSGFRSKLQWEPSDDLKITLEMDYIKSHDTVPNGVFVATGQEAYPTDILKPNPGLAGNLAKSGIIPSLSNTTISTNETSGANDDNGGLALTIEKALGDYTLTSITAYRIWHNTQRQDYDAGSLLTAALPQIQDRGDLLFDQFTEETRIASPKGGFIDYQAGLYYMLAVDNEQYDRQLDKYSAAGPVFNRGLAQYGTDGNDLAIFGEANLNFTDKLRGVLGLRLVKDDLTYTFGRISTSPVSVTGIAPRFSSEGDTEAAAFSDRAGLQYDITPDVMAYVTYSRGYKGPAFNVFFNMTALQTNPLKPETSNDYEVGLKSRLLNDRLVANLDGFIEDFSDYQANFPDEVAGAVVTRLINAGSVSSKGVEGDITARPVPPLNLTGLFAFTQARVDSFICPPTLGPGSSCNINGEPLPFAPRWKFDGRASYDLSLTDDYVVTLASDYVWQSKTQYQLSETPQTIQPAYGIWNASIGLANLAQDWRVTGLVKNITNQNYSSYLAFGSVAGVERWVPRDYRRYFGIELHKSF